MDVVAHVAGLPGTWPELDVLNVNFLGMRRMVRGMLDRLNPGGSVVVVASTAGTLWQHRIDVLDKLLAVDTARSPGLGGCRRFHVSGLQPLEGGGDPDGEATGPHACANHRIRINVVRPGPVETPILADFEATMGKEFLDGVSAAVGRHARVGDIVPVTAFLSSSAAGCVIGQDIHVDAGFTSSLVSAAH